MNGTSSIAVLVVGLLASTSIAEAQSTYTPYFFGTLAGNGPGGDDGSAAAARFDHPYGIGADADGNLYVSDSYNCTIRKITPQAVVTTVAGLTGAVGSTNGSNSAARFNEPQGVAADSAGNLYVADTGNHTIRKITPAGAVTTLAGLPGTSGSADGTGNAARFKSPRSVAVDAGGNIYVADSGNHTIRKITPGGTVSTFAGLPEIAGNADGSGFNARFRGPAGVALDGGGNVYVADANNHTLRKITPDGAVSTLAGVALSPGSANGTGSAARFAIPAAVAVDSGGLIYVADRGNEIIRRVTAAGEVTTLAGAVSTPGVADGTGSAARFNAPLGVALDPAGTAYVADGFNGAIRKVTPAGVVTTFAGIAGSGGSADEFGSAARFRSPRGICVDAAGAIYIAEGSYSAPVGNHTIRRITPDGLVSTIAGSPGSAGNADGNGQAARFRGPYGIAAASTGNLYVADTLNQTIRKITSDGTVTTIAGLAGNTGSADGMGSSARFNYPTGVAVDTAENIYVADHSNNTIRKITPTGDVTTLAGVAGVTGAADGQGPLARFSLPTGLTIDTLGNLYVADEGNHKIRKITPNGVVSTVAGTGFVGSNDGAAPNAQFRKPVGVATDLAGNFYVADSGNNLVRRIDLDGVVTTLAGSAELRGGNTEGAGGAARFGGVDGVAVDSRGNVFVASSGTNTIRIGHATTFPLWASAFFNLQELSQPAVSDDLADPDGDGMPNLLEYAFNTNPRASSSVDRIQPAIDPSEFSLFYPRLRGLSDVTYAIEGSADLIAYGNVSVEETVVADNDAKQMIRAGISRMAAEKLFFRLRVSR